MKDLGGAVYYPIYTGLSTSYTDSELTAGTSYNYKIYATNIAGSGIISGVMIGTAGALTGKIMSVSVNT
jgi:hypothetical protein